MIIFQKRIYRQDLRENPNVTYVFGDNIARVGLGGQAKEMRDEPNAVGIPTKVSPYEFMSDDGYKTNIKFIWFDFLKLFEKAMDDSIIVWPSDGIGTGLAQLNEKAPRTYKVVSALSSKLYHAYQIPIEGQRRENYVQTVHDFITYKQYMSS